MNDTNDWYSDYKRRKALAEIQIAKEISKTPSYAQMQQDVDPTPKQIHNRYQKAVKEFNKPSFGMMLLGSLLTLTSLVLVSMCFVSTVNSYDVAVNDTEHVVVDGGPLPARPPMMMFHPNNGVYSPFYALRPQPNNFRFERVRFARMNERLIRG